jgi:hypothetical protein
MPLTGHCSSGLPHARNESQYSSRETEVTSTNLEDDRNNNLLEKIEVASSRGEEEEEDNEEQVISSAPESKDRMRFPSPQLSRRSKSPPRSSGIAPTPLDFSISPAVAHTAVAATPVAVVVQESIYESVAKVYRYSTVTCAIMYSIRL